MSGQRDRSFTWWKSLVLFLAFVELATLAYFLVLKNDTARQLRATPSPISEFNLEGYVNQSAGFSFDRPQGWDVTTAGRTVKVVDPKKQIALAVGPAPTGNVSDSLDTLLTLLDSNYHDVKVLDRNVRFLDNDVAVTASGQATNIEGKKMVFIVVTTEGDSQNYAIAAFTSRDKETGRTKRLVAEVVDSFEEL